LLWKLARCTDGTSKNSCRGLSRLIDNDGLSLPIEVQYVKVTCRRRKPKVKDFDVHWPVLSMRNWFTYILKSHPGLCLGGHSIDEDWPKMHESFWARWKEHEPSHHIFSSGKPLSHCLPFFTHGDEGQTTRKTPFLVESFQCAISWKGMDYTTMSGIFVIGFSN